MITPTHVVTNALVRLKRIDDDGIGRWFVFGGLAPDLGLYGLTIGGYAFFPLVRGLSVGETSDLMWNDLFFNNPYWLTIHNTFHSPVVLAALTLAGKASGRVKLTSFALGCMLHTAMDIPVHHDDGPLVFFPFNWNYRVNSPVSYYDPDHYGRIVAPIDFAITILGGAYLARQWWVARKLAAFPGS